jgi:hypothetical protein
MEDFVTFELAVKLKEKGFTLPKSEIIGKFDSDGLFHSQLYINFTETMDLDEIIAPMISQVLKWLRDEKKIHIGVLYHNYYAVWIQPMKRNESEHVIHDCKTHEGAAIAGIEYVLDNLI